MNATDRKDFKGYLRTLTNAQVQGVYDKEIEAGRLEFAELAQDEATLREMELVVITEKQARKWMKQNVGEEFVENGEINCTRLAEACADAFNLADEGGILDDETHFIWDIAVEVAEEYEG